MCVLLVNIHSTNIHHILDKAQRFFSRIVYFAIYFYRRHNKIKTGLMYRIIFEHDIEICHFITTTKVTVTVWNVFLYAEVEMSFFLIVNSVFFSTDTEFNSTENFYVILFINVVVLHEFEATRVTSPSNVLNIANKMRQYINFL